MFICKIKAIEKGIEAAEQGEFASEDEVPQAFSKWGIIVDKVHFVEELR